ncbi:MAG: hypothetical protein IPH31_23760 [Lewinellaceae bacterium]|nr:hypothetical protein [Lewinellaceae bacterium]
MQPARLKTPDYRDGLDLSNQTLFIRGVEYVQHLRVYDMRGTQVVF